MLNVYKVMSNNITTAITANGEGVTKQPLIKSMRVVKKETLKLISDWISRTSDHAMVGSLFVYLFLYNSSQAFQVNRIKSLIIGVIS